MIHMLCNNGIFWEPFAYVIYKHYDVFYSKYKTSNAFVVAKVEGKLGTVFKKSFDPCLHVDSHTQPTHIGYIKCFSLLSLWQK